MPRKFAERDPRDVPWQAVFLHQCVLDSILPLHHRHRQHVFGYWKPLCSLQVQIIQIMDWKWRRLCTDHRGPYLVIHCTSVFGLLDNNRKKNSECILNICISLYQLHEKCGHAIE